MSFAYSIFLNHFTTTDFKHESERKLRFSWRNSTSANSASKIIFRNEKNLTNTNEKNWNPGVKFVLLLNSFGRSGTSWIAELISQQKHSFYIFEPDYYTVNILGTKMTKENAPLLIKSNFLCNFQSGLVEWSKTRMPPSSVFRSEFTRACKNVTECIVSEKLESDCKNSNFRIIKVSL